MALFCESWSFYSTRELDLPEIQYAVSLRIGRAK